MYEKIATVTVSIEEMVSLGQGERGPSDSFICDIRNGDNVRKHFHPLIMSNEMPTDFLSLKKNYF